MTLGGVSSLPGARSAIVAGLAAWACALRRDSWGAAPTFPATVHGRGDTAACEHKPWILWPLSVSPTVNACALAQAPACTGWPWCGMGPRKQTLPSLPDWPSEPGDGSRGGLPLVEPLPSLVSLLPHQRPAAAVGRVAPRLGGGGTASTRGWEGDTAAVFLPGQSLY